MKPALSNLCKHSRLNFHVTIDFVTTVIYTFSLLEIVLKSETEEMETGSSSDGRSVGSSSSTHLGAVMPITRAQLFQ
jgi:hypothetical protein